jgi:hypothetical protein
VESSVESDTEDTQGQEEAQVTVLRDVLIIAAALAGLAVLIFALWLRHMVRTHGGLVLIGRWHIGHPLRGRPKHERGWSRPERIRATFRVSGELAVVLALAGLVAARTVTLVMLAFAAAFALLLAVAWAVDKLTSHAHNRDYVTPLERTVTAMIGEPPEVLQIERDGSAVQSVTLEWAREVEIGPPEQAMVLDAVTRRLSIEAPEEHWNVLGRKREVTFVRSTPPPDRVHAHEITGCVREAAEHEIVLGLGKKAQVMDVSLDTEIPHLGFCMASGDGKSTAAMNTSTQVLYHGGIVAILDYKLMSHMWARGLPNVAYAGTPEELHELLIWLAWDDDTRESELTRRKKVALASADIRGNVHANIGPRILVVAEELNSTQKKLKTYWRQIGGKGPSPAAEALEEIHFTGRQLRIHCLDIAQRLSARATSSGGSADSRENIGAILFSNPSASTWKMLADGHAQPPATDHKGRYQLYTRKTVRELQGVLWDEQEARDFALSGTVAVPRDDMPFTGVPAVVGHEAPALMQGPDLGFVVGHEPPEAPVVPGAVTLREAAEAQMFPSVAAARKAVQRAALQPVGERGVAHLFSVADLYACQPGRNQR